MQIGNSVKTQHLAESSNSFIANVNLAAQNLPYIYKLVNEFSNEDFVRFQKLCEKYDLKSLLDDLKKGTLKGLRKLDINLLTNMSDYNEDSSDKDKENLWNDPNKTVYYKAVTFFFSDGTHLYKAFTKKNVDNIEIPALISNHNDLYDQIVNWNELSLKLFGVRYNIVKSADSIGTWGVLRFVDDETFSTKLLAIQLHTNVPEDDKDILHSVILAKDYNPEFNWVKTTSGVEALLAYMFSLIPLGKHVQELLTIKAALEPLIAIGEHINKFVSKDSNKDTIFSNLDKLKALYENLEFLTSETMINLIKLVDKHSEYIENNIENIKVLKENQNILLNFKDGIIVFKVNIENEIIELKNTLHLKIKEIEDKIAAHSYNFEELDDVIEFIKKNIWDNSTAISEIEQSITSLSNLYNECSLKQIQKFVLETKNKKLPEIDKKIKDIEISLLSKDFKDVIGVCYTTKNPENSKGSFYYVDINGYPIQLESNYFTNNPVFSGITEDTESDFLGNHFVKIPKFYIKTGVISHGCFAGSSAFWVSSSLEQGFKIHPAFTIYDDTYLEDNYNKKRVKELDYIYVGKYLSCYDMFSYDNGIDERMYAVSKPDKTVAQYCTNHAAGFYHINDFNKDVYKHYQKLGKNVIYHNITIQQLDVIQKLFVLKHLSLDAQYKVSLGETGSVNTLNTPIQTNSEANMAAVFEGITGLWGCSWQRISGFTLKDGCFRIAPQTINTLQKSLLYSLRTFLHSIPPVYKLLPDTGNAVENKFFACKNFVQASDGITFLPFDLGEELALDRDNNYSGLNPDGVFFEKNSEEEMIAFFGGDKNSKNNAGLFCYGFFNESSLENIENSCVRMAKTVINIKD